MSVSSIRKANKVLIVIPALAIQLLASGFTTSPTQETTPSQGVTSVNHKLEYFNKDIITIQAGDTKIVNKLLNRIYEDGVSLAVNPQAEASVAPNTLRYTAGNYEVTFENFDPTVAGEQDIYMYLQNTSKSNISDNYKLSAVDTKDDTTEIAGVINTYHLNVKVEDSAKPVIELSETEIELELDAEFNPSDYVSACYDLVDGTLPYEINTNVDTSVAGDYSSTYTAVDKNGNATEVTMFVTVKEEEKEEVKETRSASSSSNNQNFGVATGSISAAALSQVGQNQDCTALVSRSLAAVGINYRGAPAGYMSLGPIVSASQAKPGDVIYYANGGTGFAHVAIYIGNGQAVHGGWHGNQTVVASAYVGSGPVFISIN